MIKKKKIPLVRPSKVEVLGNILFGVNMTEWQDQGFSGLRGQENPMHYGAPGHWKAHKFTH